MKAWRENESIDFSFFNAHDLYEARDTSKPESIKSQLRERMKNAKQFVLLGSVTAKKKGSDGTSFLAYEVNTMLKLGLPIVVANVGGGRKGNTANIPKPLLDAKYYMMCVSLQPKIIQYALNNYAVSYADSSKTGSYQYNTGVYTSLDL